MAELTKDNLIFRLNYNTHIEKCANLSEWVLMKCLYACEHCSDVGMFRYYLRAPASTPSAFFFPLWVCVLPSLKEMKHKGVRLPSFLIAVRC